MVRQAHHERFPATFRHPPRQPIVGASLVGARVGGVHSLRSIQATYSTLISSITTDEENDHADEEPAPSGSQRQGELPGPSRAERYRSGGVLGVARHTLSRVLNGHAAISPDMAIRLEKAGWSSADFWLNRQTAYNLAQARKGEDKITSRALPAPGHCVETARYRAVTRRQILVIAIPRI